MDTLFDDIRRLGGEGILLPEDIPYIRESTVRVFELMRDGQWHTMEQINLTAGEDGIPASEGLRRLRELRQWFTVERQRIEGTRRWVYRLKSVGE